MWKTWCSCWGFPGQYLVSSDGNHLIFQRELSKSSNQQTWLSLPLTKVLWWSKSLGLGTSCYGNRWIMSCCVSFPMCRYQMSDWRRTISWRFSGGIGLCPQNRALKQSSAQPTLRVSMHRQLLFVAGEHPSLPACKAATWMLQYPALKA